MIGARFDMIKIVRDKRMMRTAWMAYDAEGRVLSCGAGAGSPFETPNGNTVAKIRCGTNLYDALVQHIDAEPTAEAR